MKSTQIFDCLNGLFWVGNFSNSTVFFRVWLDILRFRRDFWETGLIYESCKNFSTSAEFSGIRHFFWGWPDVFCLLRFLWDFLESGKIFTVRPDIFWLPRVFLRSHQTFLYPARLFCLRRDFFGFPASGQIFRLEQEVFYLGRYFTEPGVICPWMNRYFFFRNTVNGHLAKLAHFVSGLRRFLLVLSNGQPGLLDRSENNNIRSREVTKMVCWINHRFSNFFLIDVSS